MNSVKLRLYHYWRSSSSWRVRWALAHKNIPCEFIAVDLLTQEADEPAHLARNPMGYVPVLELLDRSESKPAGRFLTESMAILEWIEERFPQNPLLSSDPETRAHQRRLCEVINSGTQPLQNLTALLEHSADALERKRWAQHWIRKGLTTYAAWTGPSAAFSCGSAISLPDLFLIPQCYGALRQEVDLSKEFPTLHSIYEKSLQTPSCQASHPDRFTPRTG